ncbi:MAG: toxin-antitoxin system HicB family antitoxin [Gemmatimonadaceae bacterium]
MSTISLRLPESLHERVRAVAEREGVSINQLITIALAEKLSAAHPGLPRGAGGPWHAREVRARARQGAGRAVRPSGRALTGRAAAPRA